MTLNTKMLKKTLAIKNKDYKKYHKKIHIKTQTQNEEITIYNSPMRIKVKFRT